MLLNLIKKSPEGGGVQRKHFLAMLREVSGRDMESLYEHLVEDDAAIDPATHLEGTGFGIVERDQTIETSPDTAAEQSPFEAALTCRP